MITAKEVQSIIKDNRALGLSLLTPDELKAVEKKLALFEEIALQATGPRIVLNIEKKWSGNKKVMDAIRKTLKKQGFKIEYFKTAPTGKSPLVVYC